MRERAGVQTTSPFLFCRQPGSGCADRMNTEYHDQVSQPIIFKRGTTLVAPVLLWLMDALPAVLAGVMFYPLTRIYDVEFDKEFLVLSILAATFTLAMWPSRNPTRQIISGRLEL